MGFFGECHGDQRSAGFAPTASGRKATEPADGVSEGNPRRERVRGFSPWQLPDPHQDNADHQRYQESAEEHPARAQEVEREYLSQAPEVFGFSKDH